MDCRLAWIALLLVGQWAAAADISGPAEAPAGSLVSLTVAEPHEDRHYHWNAIAPRELAFLAWPDNTLVAFAAPAGKAVEMQLLEVWLEEGLLTVVDSTHTMQVLGPEPGPNPPGPGPPDPPEPDPDPPGPGPEYGIAEIAYEAVLALPAQARQDARRVADAVDGVASKIAAGAITTISQAKTEFREKASQASTDAFKPALDRIAVELTNLQRAGVLGSLNDYVREYRQIALGIRAAAPVGIPRPNATAAPPPPPPYKADWPKRVCLKSEISPGIYSTRCYLKYEDGSMVPIK